MIRVLPLLYLFSYTLGASVGLGRNYVAEEENEHRMTYFLVDREGGGLDIEDLTVPATRLTVSETDVTYYFCTRSNRNGTIIVNPTDLPKEVFNPDNEILIIIHGWHNDYSSPVNQHIKSAALDKFDLNVIIVDWNPISKKNYITAMTNVPKVANLVAEFVQSLISNYDISLSRVMIAGHSLGAHLSGIVGSALEGKVSAIVALDPAGPLISTSNKDYCIDSSDAEYVQVIHTDGNLLGMMSSIGHSDYFPNGGNNQPGCGLDITTKCSHGRSYEYYAESIRKSNFLSEKCDSYSEFTKGSCTGIFSYMGGYPINKTVSGDFYLDTNDKYPYAIDEEKIMS